MSYPKHVFIRTGPYHSTSVILSTTPPPPSTTRSSRATLSARQPASPSAKALAFNSRVACRNRISSSKPPFVRSSGRGDRRRFVVLRGAVLRGRSKHAGEGPNPARSPKCMEGWVILGGKGPGPVGVQLTWFQELCWMVSLRRQFDPFGRHVRPLNSTSPSLGVANEAVVEPKPAVFSSGVGIKPKQSMGLE